AVLHWVHGFFVSLEGIFRRMKPEITRKANSVARSIAADMQNYEAEAEYLEACRDATTKRIDTPAYPPRLDDDMREEREREPKARGRKQAPEVWTLEMASRCWKLSGHLRFELMQTRMTSLLVEWCETEDQRSPSVCYDDICFMYDASNSDTPIRAVKKGPQNNCYVKIPHPILDPVMECNMERLQLFYQRTWWCNIEVFLCCQAAISIAKRGLNVDRCFIGISPGGEGQSLFSMHLAEMYKHNHAFFDPNIWHLDEELRKQVESFARCFVLTGQEAPETNKKLHIDLYKKTISADGIMGRKPYGYIAHVHYCWMDAKARFIHEKFLVKYPDHEKDGIIEADPIQCAAHVVFLRDRGSNMWRKVSLIYSTQTLKVIKKVKKSDAWDNLRRFLVQQMIEKELGVMTFYDFKKLALISADHPNLSKSDMWDALEKNVVARAAIGKQKTSKEKPGAYIPILRFKHEDVLMDFQEEHDVGLARRYAQMCRGRGANAENMKLSIEPWCQWPRKEDPLLSRYADKPAYSVKGRRYTSNGGKEIINTVLNGGTPPSHLREHDLI
ncbi:unnamed protein product, partial [Symbiodinium sp. KB8]